MSDTHEAPTSFCSPTNSLGRVDSANCLSGQLDSPISKLAERFHDTGLERNPLHTTLDEDDDENYTGWTVTEDDSISVKEATTYFKDKQGHVRFYEVEVTVKNLLTVFALCERQTDMLHSVQRIGGSVLPTQPIQDRFIHYPPASGFAEFGLWDDLVYNLPLSARHHIGVHHRFHCSEAGYESLDTIAAYDLYVSGNFGKGKGYEPEDVDLFDEGLLDEVHTGKYPSNMIAERTDLEKAAHQYSAGASVVVIQNAPTILALRWLMTNGNQSTINLDNICGFPWDGELPDKKMTIEFRQHDGTLDVQQVLSWVDFVVSAIRYSHDEQGHELMANTRFSDQEYDAIDLLTELGCNEQTIQHYTSKLSGNDARKLYADLAKAAASEHVSKLSITEEGAYGQFSDVDLDKLFSRMDPKPSDEARERLKLSHGHLAAFPEGLTDMVQDQQFDERRTHMQTRQNSTNPHTQAQDYKQDDSAERKCSKLNPASDRPNKPLYPSSESNVATFAGIRSRSNSAETSSMEDELSNDSDEDPSAQILESVKQILPSPGESYPEKVTEDWAELELAMEGRGRRDSETSVLTFEF
ncbi:hypothetical protein KC367_g4790 [Hortaea werneckii]|nr:hypothetical protein KC342_g7535 [Hortaea werneckii]KAI7321663.1 hypothetical protein KC340_g7320 [Hortaea werneckii]KAI7398541.1 hypothetical protein KC328_g4413 [Hortaea werneckii]KAI7478366.1 hypothetical protein KC351_g8281 [Hortaea werneckii]KAI7488121.1 hypothetical protein KC357_g2440 [Hortaea werneckii]